MKTKKTRTAATTDKARPRRGGEYVGLLMPPDLKAGLQAAAEKEGRKFPDHLRFVLRQSLN